MPPEKLPAGRLRRIVTDLSSDCKTLDAMSSTEGMAVKVLGTASLAGVVVTMGVTVLSVEVVDAIVKLRA